MTIDAPVAPAASRQVPVAPVTQARCIRSEWIKLSTLRSTWLTLAAAVVGTIVVGAAACWDTNDSWNHLHDGELAHFNAIDDSLTGVVLAQLAVAVLGVLVISGEYATGMIRTTLGAAPRRLPVLWAKLTVFGSMIAASMLVTTFVSFLVGQAFLQTHGTTLGATHAVQSIVGAAFYLTAVAVIAVAVGFVVRSIAGGIAVIVALLLVLPGLADVLPLTVQNDVLPYLPSNAGSALYTVLSDQSTVPSVPRAVVTLLAWCAVAVGCAAAVLRRRDA